MKINIDETVIQIDSAAMHSVEIVHTILHRGYGESNMSNIVWKTQQHKS